MKTSSLNIPPGRKRLARLLRQRSTQGEAKLWRYLRNRGMGVKFRRQVLVGPYIADFLSLETKLIVEVDGSQHGRPIEQQHDRARDQALANEGYEVIRFWDYDILKHLDACLKHLATRIEDRKRGFTSETAQAEKKSS